jgi:hypothetical protein
VLGLEAVCLLSLLGQEATSHLSFPPGPLWRGSCGVNSYLLGGVGNHFIKKGLNVCCLLFYLTCIIPLRSDRLGGGEDPV